MKDSDYSPRQILEGVDPQTRLPYGVSQYYKSLARSQDPDSDPIAAQFIPRPGEQVLLPYESGDPISDKQYEAAPRLIHHYHDRALILVNDRCATYCRHCFRRHFTGSSTGRLTGPQLEEICRVLSQRPQIQELLLSGGDPLMLPDGELQVILEALTGVNPDYIFRMATRIPVVMPGRITEELADMLGRYGAMWIVTHVNHPREITPEFTRAIDRLVSRGMPVLNQAVLLRGVNDDEGVLEDLMRGLLRAKVKPYYLFQGDLAGGTRHFRTSIFRGLELMKHLRSRLSGMAIPTYAVDLPEGGGKIPLHEGTVLGVFEGWYHLQGPDGQVYRYPHEGDESSFGGET